MSDTEREYQEALAEMEAANVAYDRGNRIRTILAQHAATAQNEAVGLAGRTQKARANVRRLAILRTAEDLGTTFGNMRDEFARH